VVVADRAHPASVAGRAALVQRIGVWLAMLLGAALPVTLVAHEMLTGFVNPDWLGAVFVLVIIALPVTIGALAWSKRILRNRGIQRLSVETYYPQVPRQPLIYAWTTMLIVGVVMISMAGQRVLPAWLLGPTPAHTVALTAREGASCRKCSVPVVVTFDVNGTLTSATLAGADGLQGGDETGLSLVFDPKHPDRVMRSSDWRQARQSGERALLVTGLGVLALCLLIPVTVIRRRRAQFGTLKPGTRVISIHDQTKAQRAAVHVEFADNTATTYLDTPRLRAALRQRMAGLAETDC